MRRKGGRGFYGEIEILVLKTLSHGSPMHGLAIIDAVRETSGEHLHIEDAALYPALHRLDRKGFISGEWGVTDRGRRARIYTLTKKGRKKLAEGAARWDAHAQAVYALLRTEEG